MFVFLSGWEFKCLSFFCFRIRSFGVLCVFCWYVYLSVVDIENCGSNCGYGFVIIICYVLVFFMLVCVVF